MDVNAKLDKIRHAIGRAQYFSDLGQTGANYTWQLEQAADAFTVLDDWLSRGGSRPSAWEYVHPLGDAHLPSREQVAQGNTD